MAYRIRQSTIYTRSLFSLVVVWSECSCRSNGYRSKDDRCKHSIHVFEIHKEHTARVRRHLEGSEPECNDVGKQDGGLGEAICEAIQAGEG